MIQRHGFESPLFLIVAASLLLLSNGPQLTSAYPTINQGHFQQNSYMASLEKSFIQPPALEETIDEVQKILEKDPSLPRLTRGEIEELYEKVTREEYEKSIEAGDMGRADSMRALMLVLPYNTDNNTEENLQELYTRPPVTKVIDGYTPPQPIKFITHDPSAPAKSEAVEVGKLDATTYKPSFSLKTAALPPSPTTYHPPAPLPVMYKMTPSLPESIMQFQPVTNAPVNYGATPKPVQRFSSHYSAKNADFLKLPPPLVPFKPKSSSSSTTSTVRPVADVLESLGIVGQAQTQSKSRHRFAAIDDYLPAESAPQPVVSAYVPSGNLAPQIKPDAYSSFKPLNIGEEIRAKPEVEDYLTRFGIVGGRRRKAMKKGDRNSLNVLEQISQESEIATAKVPTGSSKARKGVQGGGGDVSATELEKLLENLQELERLNLQSKTATTTTTTPRPTTTTTTTTTTTSAPVTVANLITNGAPLLIEAKKPRRRIDPHIDINYGAASNQHNTLTGNDQLSKLLENLQELEKLRVNPENALRPVTKPVTTATTTTTTTTTAAPSAALTNRFSDAIFQQQLSQLQQQQKQQQQRTRATQQLELQQLLQQLQAAERANAKPTTPKTTTTTRPYVPAASSNVRGGLALNDLSQLRKLLTDDRELERLYEQARGKRPSATPATTTTTTTTTTKPPTPSLSELQQLQKYLAAFELAQTTPSTTTTTTTPSTTTTTTTTTTTPPPPPPTTATTTTTSTTTTTTTTTTPRPTTTTTTTTSSPLGSSFAQRISPPKSSTNPESIDNSQLQELISRVQQLERQHTTLNSPPTASASALPSLGFISRKVNAGATQAATANDYHVPRNDFAQLQQLYREVARVEQQQIQQQQIPFGRVEISTAATTGGKRTQDYAQRIIDITNDTGTGSSLQEVDAYDFVQLQKLLRKVQELERVKIVPSGAGGGDVQTVTAAPSLMTAASAHSPAVQPHIVYPQQTPEPPSFSYSELDDLKLDLPVYERPSTSRPQAALTSSEELHELVLATPANPLNAVTTKQERAQFQNLFKELADAERDSYRHMQPPMIHKMTPSVVTNEPPRFIATRKPEEVAKQRQEVNSSRQQSELAELQKLLNNAQQLEQLGITLPQELSQKIENKLLPTEQAPLPETTSSTTSKPELVSTSTESVEEPSEKTVVFSVTTMKSLVPKTPRPTSESSLELPIISYNKVIEAAVRQAASKFGLSTEQTLGFRRRSDTDVEDMATDDEDLMGEFSEINYQLAMPASNETQLESTPSTTEAADISNDLGELQRLIGNLQELQRLNLSVSPDLLRKADAKYLETFKQPMNTEDDNKKNRRQSVTPSTSTAVADSAAENVTLIALGSETVESSTSAPTRVNLDLGLSDDDVSETNATEKSEMSNTTPSTTSTTTEESSSTTEDEPRNGSLADLEDSFGPNPMTVTETSPPAKKKNGFYFLADWNSFLEVGDGDDQVVVRFSPKIGDPRLFIPVKIP